MYATLCGIQTHQCSGATPYALHAGMARLSALGITPARKVLVLDSGDLRPRSTTTTADTTATHSDSAGTSTSTVAAVRAAAASGGNLTALLAVRTYTSSMIGRRLASVMSVQGSSEGGDGVAIKGWRASAKQEGIAVVNRCALHPLHHTLLSASRIWPVLPHVANADRLPHGAHADKFPRPGSMGAHLWVHGCFARLMLLLPCTCPSMRATHI